MSPIPLDGAARLTHLGVIRAEGEDTASFLQGQLSHDFVLLGERDARLAAWCSAKGRMLASFVGFKRSPSEVWLVCSRDLLPATLKRLSLFVLRAKVKLSDASDAVQMLGLAGAAARPQLGALPRVWAKVDMPGLPDAGAASLVRLPDALGQPRLLWAAPAGLTPPAAPPLALDLWQWSAVMSGVATLSQPVVDAFVPQMLNYESVGGVNFKKGCYPGQEVVARSQFRGTLKRRGYIVHCDAALQAGQDLFHSSDAEQPCGTVAQAAAAPTGGWNAIVSMQITAAANGQLTAGAPAGPPLTLLPLPYPLLEDI